MSEIQSSGSESGFAIDPGAITPALKDRIVKAYRLSCGSWPGDKSDLWSMIFEKNADIHAALMTDGADLGALDRPGDNFLFYGFDGLYLDFAKSLRVAETFRQAVTDILLTDLRSLATAVGAVRGWNTEGGSLYPDKRQPEMPAVDAVLDQIEEIIGFPLDFPNPFPEEFGLLSSRGVISQRALQGIYQAWRLKGLADRHGGRVLEIGAGLGRTAYYAVKFGVPDYTIIDLPMTNVSQALFLGSVLPPEMVALNGEDAREAKIRIQSPQWLDAGREPFDIFFNADSLTEMSEAAAVNYARHFTKRAKVLLSINHEANRGRVTDLEPLAGLRQSRVPYWFRPGYVEEVYAVG